jgi:hypothetical protein
MFRVRLPLFKDQQEKPPGTAAQTTAAIVVALATVFSVVAQSKDNPKLAVALVALSSLVFVSTFARRVVTFL